MSKRQIIILLGAWVMVILHLGFPDRLDWILLLITGAIIIAVAYRMRSEPRDSVSYKNDKPYIDNHSER